jgi:hypothetical protein
MARRAPALGWGSGTHAYYQKILKCWDEGKSCKPRRNYGNPGFWTETIADNAHPGRMGIVAYSYNYSTPIAYRDADNRVYILTPDEHHTSAQTDRQIYALAKHLGTGVAYPPYNPEHDGRPWRERAREEQRKTRYTGWENIACVRDYEALKRIIRTGEYPARGKGAFMCPGLWEPPAWTKGKKAPRRQELPDLDGPRRSRKRR